MTSPPDNPSHGNIMNDSDEPDDNNIPSPSSILSLSFNQDGGCLAIGTTRGFRICNVHPFQETFRRTFPQGGVSIVEMLFRCNLLALVGGGLTPRYPPNKVMIWDDHRGRTIGELSFRQPVLGVKLRRDRVAVALSDRVYLYNFSDLTLLDQIPTVSNPMGLLCLSPDTAGAGAVMACPSITKGGVRVELYACRKTLLLDAHEGSLAALALSVDGVFLATASEKGTVIRVFTTQDGNGRLVHELRRGVERATINCLTFSLDKMWLGVCSDRGTAHVFNLMPKEVDADKATGTHATAASGTGYMSGLMSRVKKGEGSYAQIRGICEPTICAFVPDRVHTLAVVGKGDGSILLADFGNGPGEAVRVGYHVFFKKNQSQFGDEGDNDDNADAPNDNDDEIVFGDDEENGFVNIEKGGRDKEFVDIDGGTDIGKARATASDQMKSADKGERK